MPPRRAVSVCVAGAHLLPDPAWSPDLSLRPVGRGSGESLMGTRCAALRPSDKAGHRGSREHWPHF